MPTIRLTPDAVSAQERIRGKAAHLREARTVLLNVIQGEQGGVIYLADWAKIVRGTVAHAVGSARTHWRQVLKRATTILVSVAAVACGTLSTETKPTPAVPLTLQRETAETIFTSTPTPTATPTPTPTATATATPKPTETRAPTATSTATEMPVKFSWTSPMTTDESSGDWNGWRVGGKRQGGQLEVITENGIPFPILRATVTDNTTRDRDGRLAVRIYNSGGGIIKELSDQPKDQGGCKVEVPFRFFDPAIYGPKKATSVVSAFSNLKDNDLIGAVNIDSVGRPILIVFYPNSGRWYKSIADDEPLKPGEFTTLGFLIDDNGVHLLRNGVIKKTLKPHPDNRDRRVVDVHAGAYIIVEDDNYPKVPNGTIIDNGPLTVKCW